MSNRDNQLITNVIRYAMEFEEKHREEPKSKFLRYPLDKDIIQALTSLKLRDDDDDFRIYYSIEKLKIIWSTLIDKSVKCLRYFDVREPFLKHDDARLPVTYGIDELRSYFDKYTNFETMLYGGGKHYRDHVIHVFRVWLLGIDCLLRNDREYLEKVTLENSKLDNTNSQDDRVIQVNDYEKISIWTIIALTHDLGYPLEKAQAIIGKTRDMMKAFIYNPTLSMDLSFSGVQNIMNDYVIRFMSSKMRKIEFDNGENKYVVRLQPKYYFKFQKSLENNSHGTLSSIILFKLLTHFLESDFSINEDYKFGIEDARQFYIRREVLRAISSHTCKDIYHLSMLSFSFLLIMADDAQEWGRKQISELYVNAKATNEQGEIKLNFDDDIYSLNISEEFTIQRDEQFELNNILINILKQRNYYSVIFRDGKETEKRDFTFTKHINIHYSTSKGKVEFDVVFELFDKASFKIVITCGEDPSSLKNFSLQYFEKIYGTSYKIKQSSPDKFRCIIDIEEREETFD